MTTAYRASAPARWWPNGPTEFFHGLVPDGSLNREATSASPSHTGPDDGVVDVVPGDMSTTFTVTVGDVGGVSGWISPVADRDWYAVTLTAGQNYVFALSGSGGSPLIDTFLRLHDASGAQVASDDDSGPASYSLLSYTAPSSGTFYLDAGAFSDSSTGQYTLSASLAEGATDSIAASTATTSSLSVGASAFGSINTPGDHDWYAITLAAGQTYQISLSGFDGSPLGNATLNLRDASGALIAEGANSSASSVVTFAATSSGVYYLDAGGANDASTGSYALSANNYNGFVVNLIYDASALAAPQSFRDGIQAAANILHTMIADNNITVNLNISYSGTGGGAFAGPDSGFTENYSQIRDLLINNAAPGDHTFDALPAGSSIGGQSQVVVWNAEMRVLGLVATNDPASDGSATFATDISPSLLVGVALHELTHALGRVQNAPQPDILEFFRFTSAGNYLFDDNTPASAASYFSIDGGVTKLANFGMTSDPSDFLSNMLTTNDPFNEFYNSHTFQNLTTNDLQVLDALGYHVFFADGADLIAQSAALSGSQFSFTIRNVGNEAAAASSAGVYLSTDNIITTGDTLVTTSATDALPSYGSDHVGVTLAFTGAQTPGTYYLGAFANNSFSVSENETNNASNVVPILLGDNTANTLTGTTGPDTIFALAGNDTLIGGAGADTLIGGLGLDTSNYSSASTSDSWHRNPDGSWTVNAGAEGTDTLSSVEFLHFTDRDVALHNAARTFSGDGTSDVLFRRSDGVMASWEVSGTSISQAHFLPTAPSQWHVLGTGDFTGDGKDDILWQRTDGLVYTWIMDGGTVAAATPVTGVGAEWSCLGVGDFNGDQHADIAWQRNDGLVSIWTMNGASITQASTVTGLSSVWHLQGIGDFNSDGRDDFLWRRSDTGQMAIWEMNGSTIQTSGVTSQQAGLEWSVKGVGDFNGDGRDDILMQRGSDGMVELWTMNGLNVTAQTDIAAINPSQWSIHNIGDYNGDGKDDILWQRSDGLVYVWLMNGPNIIGAGGLSGLDHTWGII